MWLLNVSLPRTLKPEAETELTQEGGWYLSLITPVMAAVLHQFRFG